MALEFRDNDELVIQADLPAVDPEQDIEIWISHAVLHIRARRHLEGANPDRERHSDLRSGSFARDIALPAGAGEDHVRATYADGRLEVRAPLGGGSVGIARRIPVARAWSPKTAAAALERLATPRRSGREAP